MNEQTALTKQDDFSEIERLLMTGDLSKLTSQQRVDYYQAVCKSTGLNPLTRPFDYMTLNGKLTLYAKKDAADQLRKINEVSIDDVDISEVGDMYIVKVKGHDKTGRSDVEIGAVKKSDMQGNAANAQMKAVTKAKRRLTLSICGLGWLDETEVETIREARPVVVAETGEIITEPTPTPAPERKAPMPRPEQPAKPAATLTPSLSEQHRQLWTAANKAGLIDGVTVKIWAIRANDDEATIQEKIKMLSDAINASESEPNDYAHEGMADPRAGDGENR